VQSRTLDPVLVCVKPAIQAPFPLRCPARCRRGALAWRAHLGDPILGTDVVPPRPVERSIEVLIGVAALGAGAHSCLVWPVHAKELVRALARAGR
jgi:hypothetical protein